MSRGVKLSLDLNANWEESWALEKDTTVKKKILLQSEHQLVFQKEKRRGKIITLVGPFFVNEEEAERLLSLLKKKLACGGTYKDEWIELQGDFAEKLRTILDDQGYRFKSAKNKR